MIKVLIVDDDNVARRLMAETLRLEGYAVQEADNGLAGLRLALAEHPDLVLSDVGMPGMDGYGLLERLRQEASTSVTPVILMTGAPEQNEMRDSMDRGADDYLPKPFDVPTLVASVRTRLERKRAVQAHLAEAQSRLLAILDATPNFVAMVDEVTEQIVYCNPAGRRMLGMDLGADTSRFCLHHHILDSEGRQLFERWTKIARREGRWIGEGSIKGRHACSFPVELQILAPPVEPGRREWLSVIARDLSDAMQLRQAQKMEAIGRLAAGIAHEINTPIQFTEHNLAFLQEAFKGFASLARLFDELLHAALTRNLTDEFVAKMQTAAVGLDIPYLTTEIPSSLEEARHGTARVTRIVSAMKDFSHPGAKGGMPEPTSLAKAIESTITVARNEWKYVAEVSTDFDAQMPPVPLHPGEFNQVILNLLVNAAHAISDATQAGANGKGRITVTTHTDGAWAEVRVRDTGTGIPESVRHLVFEPFFTTKEIGRGTGQGLALARSVIVERHGGELSFETETGKGTCFRIRVPLHASAATLKNERRL